MSLLTKVREWWNADASEEPIAEPQEKHDWVNVTGHGVPAGHIREICTECGDVRVREGAPE